MTRSKARSESSIRRTVDLWTMLAAAAGMILSTYLLWTRAAHAPVYCPLGSGCEVVQSSRYAAVYGIPVALLGLVFYAALLILAARPMEPGTRLALALPVASAGAASSVVFTAVQQAGIRATCSLCLVSAALTVFILLRIVIVRPGRIRWTTWSAGAVAAVLAAAFLLAGYAASAPQSAEQTYAAGLARHLAASGVKFYGAYWCPHCSDQKAMFGKAVTLLPYIECDGRSPVGRPAECAAAQVRAYPTWDINGKRYEGVLTLTQLAELTGYAPPP